MNSNLHARAPTKPNVQVRVKKHYTQTENAHVNAHIIFMMNEVTLEYCHICSSFVVFTAAAAAATTVVSTIRTVAAIIFPSQISESIKMLGALGELHNNCMQHLEERCTLRAPQHMQKKIERNEIYASLCTSLHEKSKIYIN